MLLDRGEKLGEIEDKSAQMRDKAQNFSGVAKQLEEKMKNKKWYQL
jgi:syntaxin-binding protein 5